MTNLFQLFLFDPSGQEVDLVANTANLTAADGATYTVHGDQDDYLEVTAFLVNYDITVQVYQ